MSGDNGLTGDSGGPRWRGTDGFERATRLGFGLHGSLTLAAELAGWKPALRGFLAALERNGMGEKGEDGKGFYGLGEFGFFFGVGGFACLE